MNAVSQMQESERLRLLGIMGVDVYEPRVRNANPAIARGPRVCINVSAVESGEHARLLSAVMRASGIGPHEWTQDPATSPDAPTWRFGTTAEDHAGTGALRDLVDFALTLPSLADLRGSVAQRRLAWQSLRGWLRRP